MNPYDVLDDTDKFRPATECSECGANHSLARRIWIHNCDECGVGICEACLNRPGSKWQYDYATDTGSTVICPECQKDIAESVYDHLDDEESFDDDGIICQSCLNSVDQDDIIECGGCDTAACVNCVRGDAPRHFYGITQTGWLYNRRGDSFCPKCMTEEAVNENAYDHLDDTDLFSDGQLYNLTVDEDFVILYSQWSGMFIHDPLYAVVKRAMVGQSRHQQWTGYPDESSWPKNLLIDQDEAERLINISQKIIRDPEVSDDEKRIADKYAQQIDGPRWFE